MAENIVELLTDVADAIREKKGSTDKINAQSFADEIKNLPSGGVADAEKDIHFYDYDGTLLYSYTIEEAQALKELPPLPSHEGLICQEWNWDYEDVIALDRPMNIGANYITDDGKTRLVINLTQSCDFMIRVNMGGSKIGIVDWGDGSPTYNLYSNHLLTHTYPTLGKYTITISSAEDAYLVIGGLATDDMYPGLEAVYLGKNVTGIKSFKNATYLKEIAITKDTINIDFATFFQCFSLNFVVFPKECVELQQSMFYRCSNLKGVSIPAKATGNLYWWFQNCGLVENVYINQPCIFDNNCFGYSSIKEFTVPKGSTISGSSSFANINSLIKLDLRGATISSTASTIAKDNRCLRTVVFPKNAEVIGSGTLYGNISLLFVVLPENLTKIETSCFQGSLWMSYLKIPSSVVEIGNNAFYSIMREGAYDFTACNQVPTLTNAAFSGIGKKTEIRVPEDLYDEWIAATNWATYADYIKAYPRTAYDYNALVAELEANGAL